MFEEEMCAYLHSYLLYLTLSQTRINKLLSWSSGPSTFCTAKQPLNMEAFKGKFERTKADNFEEFLKVGFWNKVTQIYFIPGT